MKKVLSLVLVIAMVLSSMSFAFAAPFTDVAESNYQEAINTLVGLGVIDGYEDGTFKPEGTVTRAEMAKILVVTLGFGDLIAGSTSNFVDTKGHWADAYIGLAAGKGVIAGYPDGTFQPDKTVSYDEALTMLVRSLGYTDTCNEIKNMTWPTNFKVKAAELGITNEVTITSAGADRGGIAKLVFNALTCALVTVDVDNNVVALQDSGKDKDGNTLKIDRQLLTRLADFEQHYKVTEDVLDINSKNYAGDKVDLTPYMFQDLDVYLNKNNDKEVVFVKKSNSLVVEGTIDDVVQEGSAVSVNITDANGSIQKIKFTNTSAGAVLIGDVYLNGAIDEKDSTKFEDLTSKTVEDIKIIDNASSSKVVGDKVDDATNPGGIVLTKATKTARVGSEYVADKTKVDIFTLPLDSNDKVDLNKVTVMGDAETLEDIKVDDVVVEFAAVNASNDVVATTLIVTRENTVTGKITRVDSKNMYIDGTKYRMSDAKNTIANPVLSDEGVFYLDHNDRIVDVDTESAGPSNYAVVVGAPAPGEVDTKFGTSIDTYPQVKLATQDDETIVFDIQVKVSSAGKVSGSASVNGKDLIDSDTVVTKGNLVISAEGSKMINGTLVKYSVNKDGRLSKVEIVNAGSFAEIDLDKTTNKLASNVVVFDATDGDYAVVDSATLPTTFSTKIVRDSKGQIIVLVVADGEIDSAADVIYAYVTKGNPATNDDGDDVEVLTVYTGGAKKEIFTTTDAAAFPKKAGAYAIKYDGDAIKYLQAAPEAGQGMAVAKAVTVSAVNAKGNMIQIDGVWKSLSEYATIVGIDDADKGSVNDIRDLYDITANDKTKTVDVYYVLTSEVVAGKTVYTATTEIDLIVIHE